MTRRNFGLTSVLIALLTVKCGAFTPTSPLITNARPRSYPLLPKNNNLFHPPYRRGTINERAATTTTTTTSLRAFDATILAQDLGYVVGFGSLILYTPIAIRLVRQGTANGLTLSTWWLKLASYTCGDAYAFTNGYPISTYVETLIITTEALTILGLTAYYQNRIDTKFGLGVCLYGGLTIWLLTTAPSEVLALGQACAALLNMAALIPQFVLNAKERSSGDYSPVSAGLAGTGCMIRLFTTQQLAGSDPLLLGSFGLGLVLNWALLGQILYYGTVVEGRSFMSVLSADLASTEKKSQVVDERELESSGDAQIKLWRELESEDVVQVEERELVEIGLRKRR